MIVAAAMFIISNDQKRLVPLGTVSQGVIDVVNKLLAQGNVVVRVLAVPCCVPAWLKKDIRRQRAVCCRGLEIREQTEMAVVGTHCVRKILSSEGRLVVAVN